MTLAICSNFAEKPSNTKKTKKSKNIIELDSINEIHGDIVDCPGGDKQMDNELMEG